MFGTVLVQHSLLSSDHFRHLLNGLQVLGLPFIEREEPRRHQELSRTAPGRLARRFAGVIMGCPRLSALQGPADFGFIPFYTCVLKEEQMVIKISVNGVCRRDSRRSGRAVRPCRNDRQDRAQERLDRVRSERRGQEHELSCQGSGQGVPGRVGTTGRRDVEKGWDELCTDDLAALWRQARRRGQPRCRVCRGPRRDYRCRAMCQAIHVLRGPVC